MTGTLTLSNLEIKRVLRNKRYLLFTIGLPVVLYLSFGRSKSLAYGVGFKEYYMIAMASIGAFSGALTGNAMRISQERKDGWIRQLRISSLPASGYVVAKIIASMVTSVTSVVLVLLLGRFYGGVHLPLWEWLTVGAAIWVGAMAFAALAVAIGYRFLPDTVQPIAMFIYLGMSLFGGLWFPVSGTLQDIATVLPTYAVTRVGTDVISQGSIPVSNVAIVVAWLVGWAALAAISVRSTAEKI